MGNRMYATEEYMECLKNRTIVLDERQARLVEELSQGKNVIDLGANIGHMTLKMAKTAKYVYAFEPEPVNFDLLLMNVRLNKLDNVRLYNYAAADFNGKIDLHLCEFNNGMHRVYPSKYCKDKVQVDTVKVDDIIHDEIGFCKIDTEGAELGVLKGMKRIMREYHPTIMLEFHPPSIRECGDEPKYVYDIIMNEGYRCMLLGDGDRDRVDIPYEVLEHVTTHNVARNVVFMYL